jgi:hypothetical protein
MQRAGRALGYAYSAGIFWVRFRLRFRESAPFGCAGGFRFRLRFRESAPVGSAGRFRFRLRFRESAPFGAKNVLCLTVQVRIVVAGAGGSVQTVGVRLFTGMISSFLFRLSESESETVSACSIRVPLGMKIQRWNKNSAYTLTYSSSNTSLCSSSVLRRFLGKKINVKIVDATEHAF